LVSKKGMIGGDVMMMMMMTKVDIRNESGKVLDG